MNILPLTYLGNIQWFSKLCFSQCVIDIHEHYVKQSYRNRCDILTANGPVSLTVNTVRTSNWDKVSVRDVRIDYSKRWQHLHWQSFVSSYRNSPYFDHYAMEFEPFYTSRFDFLFDLNVGLLETVLRLIASDTQIKFSEGYIDPMADNGLKMPQAEANGAQMPFTEVGKGALTPARADNGSFMPPTGADGRLTMSSIVAGDNVMRPLSGASNSLGRSATDDQVSTINCILDWRNALSPKPRLAKPDASFRPESYWQVFSDRTNFVPNLSIIDLLFCEGPQALDIIRNSTAQ